MSSARFTAFVEAMALYVEARRVLDEKLDAYEGYSPDYELSQEFDARARTERAAAAAFRDAVLEASPGVRDA